MNRFFLVAAALGLAVNAFPAAAEFEAPGHAHVHQINKNVFEVLDTTDSEAAIFWCGASDYARRELKAGWQDRISIARGLGPSEATGQRSAVQFTLDPAALGIKTVESTDPDTFSVGDTKTVTDADGDCENFR